MQARLLTRLLAMLGPNKIPYLVNCTHTPYRQRDVDPKTLQVHRKLRTTLERDIAVPLDLQALETRI